MMSARRITEEELARRESRFETLKIEHQICKQKLDSKCEALLILSKDLDQCRSERDQFKLMAEQVRERYQTLKKQIMGKMPSLDNTGNIPVKEQDLNLVLFETREQNKSLLFELEDLKQKLHDANGDIKLLREQIARQRVGTADEGINTRHFPAHERETLVKQLETSGEQYAQLERDLQQVLDEKEELVTERDVYKTKFERLNQELNYILKGDEKRVVDIDALVMENKYLQDRLTQMEEEKSMAMATASKYKHLLERKKPKSSLKLGQGRSGGLVIGQKQVHQLLEDKSMMVPTAQTMADLQSLATALLETVNDKSLALSHQRKTNKILGTRVAELEKKIKTLEVAGLWNVPGNGSPPNLEKIKAECKEVMTLVPQLSHDSEEGRQLVSEGENSPTKAELIEQLEAEFGSSPGNSSVTSPEHTVSDNSHSLDEETMKSYFESLDLSPQHHLSKFKAGNKLCQMKHKQTVVSKDDIISSLTRKGDNSAFQKAQKAYAMEDLDLLPTKEDVVKCVEETSLRETMKKEEVEKDDVLYVVEQKGEDGAIERMVKMDEEANNDGCEYQEEEEKMDNDHDAENRYLSCEGQIQETPQHKKLEKLMESVTSKMVECSHKSQFSESHFSGKLQSNDNGDDRDNNIEPDDLDGPDEPSSEDSLLGQESEQVSERVIDDPKV